MFPCPLQENKFGAILEQLEGGCSWGKYELVRPRGMTKRDAFANYLNFQGLRREYGLPRELSESCRNNFAPPQLARAGGHSADFSFGRGGTSRGRGSDNREHFGSFQRDNNTGHRGGGGANPGFRGSFRGHQHNKESSHMVLDAMTGVVSVEGKNIEEGI